ncbi:MAG: hypothetical protein N3A66_01160 [Planctomycetota bacterium]|nr:hypothetical protein [Planctomycetota bacterium]
MQCPHCGFENLPGIVVCVRCRAQLVAEKPSSDAELLPPRPGRWKWLRPVQYYLNALIDRLPRSMPTALRRLFFSTYSLSQEAIAAMALSAAPGLGHFLRGHRRQAVAVVAIWILLVALAVIWFGHWFGWLCLGLLIGFHASAAMHASDVRLIPVLRQRLLCGAMLLVLFGSAYGLLYMVLSRDYEVIAATFACEDLDVVPGDLILMRRVHDFSECQRGDLIIRREPYYRYVPIAGNVYGAIPQRALLRLIALGGEEVLIADGKVSISGLSDEEAARLTAGVPLPREPLRLAVAKGQALAVAPLNLVNMAMPGAIPQVDMARGAWETVFPTSYLYARGVAVSHPIWRRHWFASRQESE